MERIRYWSVCNEALMQCHQIMETFEGSKETLRCIQRVEEALRRLVAITN